jgi:hypothetical protein
LAAWARSDTSTLVPPTTPPARFWHPLPFWKALAIAFVAQVLGLLPFIALREVGKVALPWWVDSAVASVFMLAAIRWAAARARKPS